MLKARLTADPDGRIALESVYHGELVAWLRTLPSSGRTWEPDRRRWLISALYAEELLAALALYQFSVQDDRASAAVAPMGDEVALWSPSGMPRPLAEAFYQLGLNGEAPLQLAELAWRFWQKHYHPDVGGDFENAAKLNTAIQTIRSYLSDDPGEE